LVIEIGSLFDYWCLEFGDYLLYYLLRFGFNLHIVRVRSLNYKKGESLFKAQSSKLKALAPFIC